MTSEAQIAQMTCVPDGDRFVFLFSGRPVKTPLGRVFSIDFCFERLVQPLLDEWQHWELADTGKKPDMTRMPHVGRVMAYLDSVHTHADRVDMLLSWLQHDVVLFRADFPEGLKAEQDSRWGEVLACVERRFDVRLMCVDGIQTPEHPALTYDRFRDVFSSLHPMALASFVEIVSLLHSVVLGLGVVFELCDVDQAFSLAHLEEDFNAVRWGVDPEALQRRHDLERQFKAAVDFYGLLKKVDAN